MDRSQNHFSPQNPLQLKNKRTKCSVPSKRDGKIPSWKLWLVEVKHGGMEEGQKFSNGLGPSRSCERTHFSHWPVIYGPDVLAEHCGSETIHMSQVRKIIYFPARGKSVWQIMSFCQTSIWNFLLTIKLSIAIRLSFWSFWALSVPLYCFL